MENIVIDYVRKEQFQVYWSWINGQIIDFAMSRHQTPHLATLEVEFSNALSEEMGHPPYFGDPTTHPEGHMFWKGMDAEKFSRALLVLKSFTFETDLEKLVTGELSGEKLLPGEDNIVAHAIERLDDGSRRVSNAFAKFLLLRAKSRGARNGSMFLEDFLSYWGNIVLEEADRAELADISAFIGGNFGSFEGGEIALPGFTSTATAAAASLLRRQKEEFAGTRPAHERLPW